MNDKIFELVASKTGLPIERVKNTILLLKEGATIPFIARYRKELTGSFDEVQIAAIQKEYQYFTDLESRKETILKTIEEQGCLSDELKLKIESTYDATELEDIYLPYKPKKRTRATIAREKGLEPLAKIMMGQFEWDIHKKAKAFVNEQVDSVDDALAGARDIVAEWISENSRARDSVRWLFKKMAIIESKIIKGKDAEAQKYRDYFDWSEPLARCASHRYLAIKRAEKEGFLRINIGIDEQVAQEKLENIFLRGNTSCREQVKIAIKDSFKRLLSPSIETEFNQLWKQKSDNEAIAVFSENLRQLLLAPPL
ncbi:MAG TPA: Tex-like N-terminal domain-containing protein, partial [Prolixibacteraceae bacterium]|nr:Tex-like N-terminal domain-containing protein [Prolixibacteraceae bacterium]